MTEDDYEVDPVASKAKLAEAAKVLWEAKYDADYKRGTTLIVEANRLDKSALQARKMLELAQREGMSLPLTAKILHSGLLQAWTYNWQVELVLRRSRCEWRRCLSAWKQTQTQWRVKVRSWLRSA